MDGQLLELKNLKFIKNVSVFRPSSVYCTTMERMVLTAYISLACLHQVLKEKNYQEYYITKV